MLKSLIISLSTLMIVSCSHRQSDSDIAASQGSAAVPARDPSTIADIVALLQQANYKAFDPGFSNKMMCLLCNEKNQQVQVSIVMTIADRAAIDALLLEKHLEGRLLSATKVLISPTDLWETLALSEHQAVQKIGLATAKMLEDAANTDIIGEAREQQPKYRTITDSLETPLVQRASYDKLAKPLLTLVTDTVKARLAEKLEGLVQFNGELSEKEVKAFFPSAIVLAGGIGSFHNVSLAEILRLSADKRIVYFESPRRVYPNPSMGGTNGRSGNGN